MRHIIWDWNGTLLDDIVIVVESVNASLDRFGVSNIDVDGYRDHYQRPVRRFYDVLFGRRVTDREWEDIDECFHETYRDSLARAGLQRDALQAISVASGAGCTQSLLSMWWHEELVPTVTEYGLDGYFARIDGNTHEPGATKATCLSRHLAALETPNGESSVMIGDSMDDAAAALESGIACVMYDGGSHHRAELESTGFPVATSLVDAVSLAVQ